MTVEEIVRKHLLDPSVKVMQLATSRDNKPWICNVHFSADENLNLYWASMPETRHSKEIADNPASSVYFLVHENTPDENYKIGISIEGTSEFLTENIEVGARAYATKFNKDEEFVKKATAGNVPLYKFTPKLVALYDTKNFPKEHRVEWNINS